MTSFAYTSLHRGEDALSVAILVEAEWPKLRDSLSFDDLEAGIKAIGSKVADTTYFLRSLAEECKLTDAQLRRQRM